MFAGGITRPYGSTSIYLRNAVNAYNSSLTKSTPTGISAVNGRPTGGRIGNYALFAGGYTGSYTNKTNSAAVNVYSSSLTRTTATELCKARYGMAFAIAGDYAIFASSALGEKEVDAYDAALTHSVITPLNYVGGGACGASIEGYALIKNYNVSVTAYDAALTQSSAPDLSISRSNLAAETIGKYALFCGGEENGDIADAYWPS